MNSIIQKDIEQIIDTVNLMPLKGKRILFTGSNGLFGRYISLLVFILNQKYNYNTKLYCLSLHEPNQDIREAARIDKNIIPRSVDLSKSFQFGEKVDYIFHAACYAQPQKFIENKSETIDLNVNTTRILLEIAKKNKARFLFFSSAEVYGEIPKKMIPVPETYAGTNLTYGVRSIYGESKRLGEAICAMYRQDKKVRAYVARISHVYGPGIASGDKRVLGEFIKKSFEEKKIILKDQGSALKTWGYISDIIIMILNIIIYGTDLIYNVGGVDAVTIKGLAEEVGRQMGSKVIIPKFSKKLPHISTDPQFVKLDITKYTREFGKTNFISFSEGISRTLEWNRQLDFHAKT
jgi:dTDP-glucose 4,6-dehydratase/UDP-glucuronate decarboxylase